MPTSVRDEIFAKWLIRLARQTIGPNLIEAKLTLDVITIYYADDHVDELFSTIYRALLFYFDVDGNYYLHSGGQGGWVFIDIDEKYHSLDNSISIELVDGRWKKGTAGGCNVWWR